GNDAGSDAGSGTTSGASSGTGSSTHTGGESGKPRDPAAPGDQDGGASVAGGVVSAKDGITLLAGRDLRLSRQVYASGTVQMLAGADAVSDAGTQLRAGGGLTVRTGEDVALAGAAVADGAVRIEAARGLRLDGSALAHAGPLDLKSGGSGARARQLAAAAGRGPGLAHRRYRRHRRGCRGWCPHCRRHLAGPGGPRPLHHRHGNRRVAHRPGRAARHSP
ncbi:hypothetical protein QEP16_03920, partial [Achromobacter insolitus]|nr:hypothetical protein [Achromobacter insolitus]